MPAENALIGVVGRLKRRSLRFLLDTGASCNFISMDLTRELNLTKQIMTDSSNVRLADGKQLMCCGTINLRIKFGSVEWQSTFYILDCDVPLIAGIPFCNDMQPFIDWSDRRVFVKDNDRYVELQTTIIDKHTRNGVDESMHVGNVDNMMQ